MISKELVLRITSSIILLPLTFYFIIDGSTLFNLTLIIVFSIASYEWHNMSKNKKYYFYGYVFLIFSLFSTYKLRFDFQNDFWPLLITFLICIFTDIGGYFFGKFFKGPKLTKFSPNKTFSGLIGSFTFSLISIPLVYYLNIIDHGKLINFILFIFLVSSISQLGDIIISFFKRVSNIKDSGKIIPGHGGLLDRVDGMLFAIPTAYYLLLFNFFNFLK